MKRLMRLVTIVVVGVVSGWSAVEEPQTAATKGVEGDWQGLLKATPQIELRITLQIAKVKDGSLSGTWGSPDEALTKLPLAAVTLKDGVLRFLTNHGVTYKGRTNEAEIRDRRRVDPAREVLPDHVPAV